ncbi:helix-turn-helix domain-containing protein [Paraburkholderia humisilvae]|uniref:helix-turn-helix domain-containing protein n=1 Tax=Paraburkholderia humisilvae TaxID=627669 RepID=UPI001583919B|nr:helix-turn-helix domain-containing protein [Paraburkholderia humisilvae]
MSTRVIPEQVLTLFLDSGFVEHAVEAKPPASIPVPAGAVVLSLRDQPETIRWVKSARVMSVRLEDRVLEDAARTLGKRGLHDIVPSSGVHDAQLTTLLQALYLEQANEYRVGRLYIDGIEQALAATLVSGHAQRASVPARQAGGLTAAQASRVAEFVRANLDRSITLEELAGYAGYSPSHFSLLFQRTFGMTAHRYLQRARIEYAKVSLAKPHRSILDIAIDCGFQTQQHFSRVFRAIVGVSPTEFKRSR